MTMTIPYAAIEAMLTSGYNAYMKGKGQIRPTYLIADDDLYEAYAANVVALTRIVQSAPIDVLEKYLAFKVCRMTKSGKKGWFFRFSDTKPEPPRVE